MRLHPSTFFATLALLIATMALAPFAVAAAPPDGWVSFTDDFDNCGGERVVVTGEQRMMEKIIVDGAGQEHIVFHRNIRGTGIGTVSGATYLLMDTVSIIERGDTVEGDMTVSTQFSELVFIRQGEATPDDDSYVRTMTRITVAPDGTQTTEIIFVSVSCH